MKFANKNKVDVLVEKGAKLVDLRSPVDYRDGSIAGAVNLPLRNFLNMLQRSDKKDSVVLIVNNLDNDSDLRVADTYATQLGYDKIYAAEYEQLKSVDKD